MSEPTLKDLQPQFNDLREWFNEQTGRKFYALPFIRRHVQEEEHERN